MAAGGGPREPRQARGRVPAVVREALQKGRRNSPARGRSLVEALEVFIEPGRTERDCAVKSIGSLHCPGFLYKRKEAMR